MIDTRLILVEGIPGSGKSTLAKRLHDRLIHRSVKTSLHLEGDTRHPIDLGWHAYFDRADYATLLRDYPGQRESVVQRTLAGEEYVLIQYREAGAKYFEGKLYEKLEAREFCYGSTAIVAMDKFTKIFCRRWEEFVGSAEGVSVFESVFFQHQIHDLLRNYSSGTPEIITHLQALLDEFSSLDPVLFYIAQQDVGDSLKRIAAERGKPSFGTEEAIAYWAKRKTIEFQAMSQLKLRSYVLDNSNYDWDRVFGTMLHILEENDTYPAKKGGPLIRSSPPVDVPKQKSNLHRRPQVE